MRKSTLASFILTAIGVCLFLWIIASPYGWLGWAAVAIELGLWWLWSLNRRKTD
jgi:hypothetical protein